MLFRGRGKRVKKKIDRKKERKTCNLSRFNPGYLPPPWSHFEAECKKGRKEIRIDATKYIVSEWRAVVEPAWLPTVAIIST